MIIERSQLVVGPMGNDEQAQGFVRGRINDKGKAERDKSVTYVEEEKEQQDYRKSIREAICWLCSRRRGSDDCYYVTYDRLVTQVDSILVAHTLCNQIASGLRRM